MTPNIQNIGINYELQNGYFSPPNVYYTCPNVPYLITITPDPGHTYMWSDGDVTTVNKPLIGSPNGTHYSLKVTWNNFCSRWEDIIVKTRQGENAKINVYADSICAGQYYAQFYTNLNNPVWNTGATTNTIQVLPLVTTTYTVSGTDDEGCARSLSKSVYVRPLPTFTVTGLNTPVCDGDSLLLTASGAASFIWGHGSQAVQGPVFHKPSNQLYPKLYATGANGCTKDSNLVANIDLSARFYFYPKIILFALKIQSSWIRLPGQVSIIGVTAVPILPLQFYLIRHLHSPAPTQVRVDVHSQEVLRFIPIRIPFLLTQ